MAKKLPFSTEEEFTLLEELGEGGFGNVCLMEYKTGDQYAVKNYNTENFNVISEVKTLLSINHPSIVKFHSLVINNNGNLSISMEYAPNGTVRSKLEEKSLTPTEKSIIALSVAYGLQELHSKDILHLDLKPLNILLNKDNYPLICDFGLSFQREKLDEYIDFLLIGSFPYIAPEILEHDKGKIGKKCDIFSFGIVLYNLLTNRQMFSKGIKLQLTGDEVTAKYENGERPSIKKYRNTDPQICELIEKCWQTDPDDRPTISEVTDFLSKIENVFKDTEVAPFNEYIEYVDQKLREKEDNSISDVEISEGIDQIAQKTFERSKSEHDPEKSRSLLSISLSANSKFRRSIFESSIKSHFGNSNPSDEEMEKANKFYMSKKSIFNGDDFLKIADNFRNCGSSFAWDFYDLAVEKGCQEAVKRIQKFLTFKNIDLPFERFVRYSIMNADSICEKEMFCLDVEQGLNCLFIAKNYIDYKIENQIKTIRPNDSENSIVEPSNSIDSYTSSNESISAVTDSVDFDSETEFDKEKIEMRYDTWIEKLCQQNYATLRTSFYQNMYKNQPNLKKYSNQYYEFMAESGCPNCANIVAENKNELVKSNLNSSMHKKLNADFLKSAELSIINGSKNFIKKFADELSKGTSVKKDKQRAERLMFFFNLNGSKKPFDCSELFKFESFVQTKNVEDSKDTKKVQLEKKLPEIKKDDDYDYYYYSDDDDDKDLQKISKSTPSNLTENSKKKKQQPPPKKKTKLVKSSPQMIKNKNKNGKTKKK